MGRIGRPHGLKGDVTVKLTTTEASRLEPGAQLVAGDRALVVRASRRHQDRWVVGFVGVSDRPGAEALRGLVLEAEPLPEDEDPDALWVHELVGADVVDPSGQVVGTVEAVQANPASDLLVLGSGALVPLTFVVGWEERPHRLLIDPPTGLFDLD